jgi:hypothetical protein
VLPLFSFQFSFQQFQFGIGAAIGCFASSSCSPWHCSTCAPGPLTPRCDACGWCDRAGCTLPTPMLVLPYDVRSHSLQTSIDFASLAPNAEITVLPWKEPEELKQRAIDKVGRFLQANIPVRAAVQ